MIRGTKRTINSTPIKRFDVGASIHNRFEIEVVDSVSGEVKQKAFAENVICNNLWVRMFSGVKWNSYIHYGDGTGTPSASDTSLFSRIGGEASTVYSMNYDYDNNVFACTTKVVIDETKAVGRILTEVGIAYSSGSTTLCTHAMLKDMNGNTVSLEKSDTDIFNIYATVFIHITTPSSYVRIPGAYRINRGCYSTGLLQFFSGVCSNPQLYVPYMLGMVPHSGHAEKMVSTTYDATNRKIAYTANRLSSTDFNVGGLPSLMLRLQSYDGAGGPVSMIVDVDPADGWFGDTHVTGEAVGTGDGTTVDFATKLGYATNAKVYVDGVETQASVDYINHVLHKMKSTYSGLDNPILSYFRVLRAPEIGYGYKNYTPYAISPAVYYQQAYSVGGQFEHPTLFENTIYKTHGVRRFAGRGLTVKVSNDLREWVTLCDDPTNSYYFSVDVPEEYQHYRYWSIQCHFENDIIGSSQDSITFYANKDLATMTNNIHFSEPPPAGAVITASYDAVCVGKDENHVFDFSVVFSFNEYVEN